MKLVTLISYVIMKLNYLFLMHPWDLEVGSVEKLLVLSYLKKKMDIFRF